jgi:AraC-like DNA-binding protein
MAWKVKLNSRGFQSKKGGPGKPPSITFLLISGLKLIDYIIETILNLDDDEPGMLTVSHLSRKLNISKSLLYYLFQAKDFTPAELLNKIKMSRAMDLLKNKRVLVKGYLKQWDFILLIIS